MPNFKPWHRLLAAFVVGAVTATVLTLIATAGGGGNGSGGQMAAGPTAMQPTPAQTAAPTAIVPSSTVARPLATLTPLPPTCNPGAVPVVVRAGNLVANPSLEEGVLGWRRIRSDGAELEVLLDGAQAHGGNCSLKLERRLAGDCPTICGYWTAPVILIDPARAYRFSAWAKGTGPALLVAFHVVDATGAEIPGRSGFGVAAGQTWTQKTVRIGPPGLAAGGTAFDAYGSWPAGAAGVVIDFAWTGTPRQDGVEGDIWIDDIFFGPLP